MDIDATLIEEPRRMFVVLSATGFNGRFTLDEKYFDELLAWLAQHWAKQDGH